MLRRSGDRDGNTADMTHQTEIQPLQRGYILRPAQRRDAWSIAALTRQLSETAMGQRAWSPAVVWFGGFVLGLVLAIGLYQPRIALQVVISMMPLGLLLGMIGLLALLQPSLTWSDYWVIEHQGKVVACARLYQNPTYSELYDLFVSPTYRRQGLGATLVQHLTTQAVLPVYLASLPQVVGFYEQLGFRSIDPHALNAGLRTRLSLTNPRFRNLGLTAMVLPPRPPGRSN